MSLKYLVSVEMIIFELPHTFFKRNSYQIHASHKKGIQYIPKTNDKMYRVSQKNNLGTPCTFFQNWLYGNHFTQEDCPTHSHHSESDVRNLGHEH